MSRLRMVGVFVAAQAVLVGVYLGVESRRVDTVPLQWERLDEARPPLRVSRHDGVVAEPKEPHLVHFWATWCAPCRTELPGLLRAAERAGLPLLAVTDEPWSVVERYFDGAVPNAIVQDTQGVAAEDWRVSGLPDTFGVRDGRVVGRAGGPRDWESPEAQELLRTLSTSVPN